MADNIKVTEGTGPKVATDEVEIDGATAHVQRVKPATGAAGTGVDVSTANPMPVKSETGSVVKVTTLEGEPKVKIAENAALVAGTAEIGKVKVTENAALVAGTAEIGKVKVTENAALVAGTAEIGKVKVTELSALVAGTAEIGKVKVTELAGEPKVKVSSLEGEPKVKVSSLEGEPKVKVSALEGEPTVKVIGTVASGAADSGNPVKTGAVAQTTLPTATTAGNRMNSQSDKYGRQLYAPNPPDRIVTGKALLENESATEVIAAGGAGVRIMVTSVLVTNASTSISTRVEILDEATSKLIGEAVKSGGGFQLVNPHGLFIGTANKPVKAKAITTGAKVDVFIGGYQMPE